MSSEKAEVKVQSPATTFDSSRIRKAPVASNDKEEDLTSKDWYRHIDSSIIINGKPIKELAAQYGNFQNSGFIKKFFLAECLVGLEGSQKRKDQALEYLQKTFNQAGFMHPVDMTLNDTLAAKGLTIDKASRSFELRIEPTKTGISISESVSYDKLQVNQEHPLRPLCTYDKAEPAAMTANLEAEESRNPMVEFYGTVAVENKPIVELSGILAVDFPEDGGEPTFQSTFTPIVFGHTALSSYVLTDSITDYLLAGHTGEYLALQAKLEFEKKFVENQNVILEGINTCVNFIYQKIGELLKAKDKNQEGIITLGRGIDTFVSLAQIIKGLHPQSSDLNERLYKALEDLAIALDEQKILPSKTVKSFEKLIEKIEQTYPTSSQEYRSGESARWYDQGANVKDLDELHERKEPSPSSSLSPSPPSSPSSPSDEEAVQWHEHKKTPSRGSETASIPSTTESETVSTPSASDEDAPPVFLHEFLGIPRAKTRLSQEEQEELNRNKELYSVFEGLEKDTEVLYIELQYRLNQLKGDLSPADQLKKLLYQQAQHVIRSNGAARELEPLEIAVKLIKDKLSEAKSQQYDPRLVGKKSPEQKPITITPHELQGLQSNLSIQIPNRDTRKDLQKALKPLEEILKTYEKGATVRIHL